VRFAFVRCVSGVRSLACVVKLEFTLISIDASAAVCISRFDAREDLYKNSALPVCLHFCWQHFLCCVVCGM